MLGPLYDPEFFRHYVLHSYLCSYEHEGAMFVDYAERTGFFLDDLGRHLRLMREEHALLYVPGLRSSGLSAVHTDPYIFIEHIEEDGIYRTTRGSSLHLPAQVRTGFTLDGLIEYGCVVEI